MRIKNISIFCLLTLGIIACSEKESDTTSLNSETTTSENSNQSFSIEGILKNGGNKKIYLYQYGAKSPTIIDSTNADASGNYSLKSKTNGFHFFGIGNSINNVSALLLKGGESVKLNADYNLFSLDYTIEGSEDTKIMQEFSMRQKAFFDAMQTLKTEIEALDYDDKANRQIIIDKAEKFKSDFSEYKYQYIDKHSHSPAIYLATSEIYDIVGDLEYLKKIEKVLFEEMNGSPFHIAVSQKVAQANQSIANAKQQKQMLEQQQQGFSTAGIAIGSMAPELNFPNPEGKNIALSSLKGKVVLLDFWASWCKPCRAENPNVVRLYNQYKDKGFTIYSYSMDKNANQWINAIQQDGLIWPNHTSDLKGWQAAGAVTYNVRSIPQTFLIGKDGKIIAIGLRGIALEEKLKELFG